nr:uncharacterized protein LOC114924919 [Arachis hypogaea]
MARKGQYTKKSKLGPGYQQPQTAPPSASGSHHDDSQVLPAGGDGVPTTSHPFRPPRTEPRPAPQMSTNSVHNSELSHDHFLEGNAPEVESRAHEVDDHFSASGAQSRKRCKTTKFWTINIIDSDGTIKPARLSVRKAMERPNGRRIVLRFNNKMHPIGDEAGLLSGVLGLLESAYGKFSIDCEGSIKKYILKSMGRSWKETRLRLYNAFYEPTFTFEQNIEHRLPGIDREHWRKFLIAPKLRRRRSAEKMRLIDQNNHIPTLAVRKASHGGWKKSVKNNEGESVEESCGSQCTKKNDGSYMNDEARAISERIEEIEQQDESSRVLSQNDSIAQVFGKEKLGRVRGVGFGLTPTQLFGSNSHVPGNRVEVEETQRKLFALQAELEGEKLKRKAMEDEAAAEKKKMQAMERALIYLFQRQGEELSRDIAVGMSSVE